MTVHSFRLVPSAYVLLLREGGDGVEVLLQLRQNTGYMDGYWACGAAGHVEDGESVVETAVREAGEELGIGVDPKALEPLTAMHRTNERGGAALEQRVDFFFLLRAWEGEPGAQEAEKNAGLRWFALDSLPERVPPHERAVLEALRASRGASLGASAGTAPGASVEACASPTPGASAGTAPGAPAGTAPGAVAASAPRPVPAIMTFGFHLGESIARYEVAREH